MTDPTATAGLRRAFAAEGNRRLARVRSLTHTMLVEHDLMQTRNDPIAQFLPHPGHRLPAFAEWFAQTVQIQLFSENWWQRYLQRAYDSGLVAGGALVEKSSSAPSQPLPAVYGELARRELVGIAAALVQQVSRQAGLAGITKQKPQLMYRQVLAAIKKVGMARLAAFVNFMVVKLHNAARLEHFRAAGVTQVGIIPERLVPAKPSRFLKHDHAHTHVDAYDPDEPRDPHGRWTSGSGIKAKKANAEAARQYATSLGHEVKVYSNPKSSFAAAYSQGTIHVNEAHKFWKDPVGNTQILFKNGQLSSGDAEHVINHEIGHALYDPPDNFMNIIGEQELVRTEVSKYASVNPKEFVSEVHAGMKGGKSYSDKVMGLFNRYARKRTADSIEADLHNHAECLFPTPEMNSLIKDARHDHAPWHDQGSAARRLAEQTAAAEILLNRQRRQREAALARAQAELEAEQARVRAEIERQMGGAPIRVSAARAQLELRVAQARAGQEVATAKAATAAQEVEAKAAWEKVLAARKEARAAEYAATQAARTATKAATPSAEATAEKAKTAAVGAQAKAVETEAQAVARLRVGTTLPARLLAIGAEYVNVLTAGDDLVCEICEDISEEGPYSLEEAQGLIPAHPNCRCAFVPAFKNPDAINRELATAAE